MDLNGFRNSQASAPSKIGLRSNQLTRSNLRMFSKYHQGKEQDI